MLGPAILKRVSRSLSATYRVGDVFAKPVDGSNVRCSFGNVACCSAKRLPGYAARVIDRFQNSRSHQKAAVAQ